MFDIRDMQEQALFRAVQQASDEETARQIVYAEQAEDHPAWVKNSMSRLENSFEPSAVKQIRMSCQCGYAMDEKLELVRDLMSTSKSMEEFANQEKARAAGLYAENGELYLQFFFCPCPMLADVERLESKAWCQCTTGYSKVLFEQAFGCPVDVELLKSIKSGDTICLMKIIPNGSVW